MKLRPKRSMIGRLRENELVFGLQIWSKTQISVKPGTKIEKIPDQFDPSLNSCIIGRIEMCYD